MNSSTSQRPGRSSKDVPKRHSHSASKTSPEGQKTAAADSVVPKIQPTDKHMEISKILYDASVSNYSSLKYNVERIIEITGRTKDEAFVALHDCDNNLNLAAIRLLEGHENGGKWETSGRKKKNRQSQQKPSSKWTLPPQVNGLEPPPAEKEEKKILVESSNRRREPTQREGSFRYPAPLRMNRGGNQNRNWRNKENENNERNLQEGHLERNNAGRSRGPCKNFLGRGRGRGGRSHTFQNRGLQNNYGFPESIDTWNNSTAEKVNMTNPTDTTMTVGNLSDVALTEEWGEENWIDNLTETKVFTPSAGIQSSTVPGLDIPTVTALGQNIDLASSLQKPTSYAEACMPASDDPSIGQVSLSFQQLLQMQQGGVASQSPSNLDFSQFAKLAEASIKTAIGLVLTPELQQVIMSQSNYSSSSTVHSISRDLHSPIASQHSSTMSSTSPHRAPLPPRVKAPLKARLPSPSKIPESADVIVTSGNGIGQSSSGSSQANINSQALPLNITSQAYFNALPVSMTMSKESIYSMGSHTSPHQKNSISSDSSQSQKHTCEIPSNTTSSNVLSWNSLVQTSSANHSVQNSSNVNSVLGLVSTSSSTTTTSVLNNYLTAGRVVPHIPQNIPAAMLGYQYIMGQSSFPFYGYCADMQFQAPTNMTGWDPGMSRVAYTTDATTVGTTLSEGQTITQTHGQAFFAAALPPSYGYYFTEGMVGGINHYAAAPPIIPVTSLNINHCQYYFYAPSNFQ